MFGKLTKRLAHAVDVRLVRRPVAVIGNHHSEVLLPRSEQVAVPRLRDDCRSDARLALEVRAEAILHWQCAHESEKTVSACKFAL